MAEEFVIHRAERKQARLRFAITAASNGGKTWTALEIAFGIVEELISRGELAGQLEGKVGMVDTERKSAQLYAHLGPFDTIDLGPPYTIERYVGALRALERAGCAVIILDSISHAWAGAGGVLSLLDKVEDRSRFSSFGKTVNPAQDEFVDAMLRSPCHIIATMRSKTAWVLEDKENARGFVTKAPKRIGMAPIQRPGIEFEFTTLVDLDTTTHAATVLKNRCPVFEKWTPRLLGREHGRQLASWLLEGAAEPAAAVDGTPDERATATLAASLRAMERAETVPDLARVFEKGQRALKAFPPAVSLEIIADMLKTLTEKKDVCKMNFTGPTFAPTDEPVLDPRVAVDVEDLLKEAKITESAFQEQLHVARIMSLPAARLQECIDWVSSKMMSECNRLPVLTDRIKASGIVVNPPTKLGSMEEMASDIPWAD